jgi:hypothetical protein
VGVSARIVLSRGDKTVIFDANTIFLAVPVLLLLLRLLWLSRPRALYCKRT